MKAQKLIPLNDFTLQKQLAADEIEQALLDCREQLEIERSSDALDKLVTEANIAVAAEEGACIRRFGEHIVYRNSQGDATLQIIGAVNAPHPDIPSREIFVFYLQQGETTHVIGHWRTLLILLRAAIQAAPQVAQLPPRGSVVWN